MACPWPRLTDFDQHHLIIGSGHMYRPNKRETSLYEQVSGWGLPRWAGPELIIVIHPSPTP